MLGARAIDPNIRACPTEKERGWLQDRFDVAVSAVTREEAVRRGEDQPQKQRDQPRGSAVQSPEHATYGPTLVQQHQWATGPLPLPGTFRISSSGRHNVLDGMFKNGEEVQLMVMVFVKPDA